ncbi:putative transcription factor interactor and regulator CCHC(Zn) family [Helianthus anomalus]
MALFSYTKDQLAYTLEVASMPTKDQWLHIDNKEKIYPPAIKRPPGRPRKKRIRPGHEPKKRQKCPRCGEYGHREKTCNNSAPEDPTQQQASTSKRGRGKSTKRRESN